MSARRLSLARPLAGSLTALGLILAAAAGHGGQAPGKGDCPAPDAGLTLPPGFCATVFADGLGHVRHMVVGADGTVYANSAPGNDAPGLPSGLVILPDSDGDGHADRVERPLTGQTGGTGIALWQGQLFMEDGKRILRYRLDPHDHRPQGAPQVVVADLPTDGDHRSHSLAVRADGALFVTSGSATNACQIDNRQAASPGRQPCLEKQTRAGIWRFDALGSQQVFGASARYASGIRNAVGVALDTQGHLFATQHGRDQLHENWPRLYTAAQGQDLPAEELLGITPGADYGWPECYYDPAQRHLVLAPEYGGNGGTAVGLCADRKAPVAAFPAHWAPNALVMYEGAQFPQAYHGGAFIAFHGSWNRAPGPQQGFDIVFQPLTAGQAAGDFILFAEGFAGAGKASGQALYRPTGLAVGGDGALYVSDDRQGRIWRITYRGDLNAPLTGVREAGIMSGKSAEPQGPPAVAGDRIALGRRLFAGEIAGAPCAGCHGPSGQGTPVGPNLADGVWLWGKGDLADIRHIIAVGVAHPKTYPAPMPAGGGAALNDEQIDALASYVFAISHRRS
jgi:glucose/arabinose dehydrogenase/mono/diheme cytochrome c family protein